VKKKLKETKVLIAAFFLISIFGIVSTVSACGSNRIFFLSIGDDLDINAKNLVIGKIKNNEGDEPSSVKAVFHQRIYDEFGKKVYTMMGKLKEGFLQTKEYVFFCPVFNVWFINVWQYIGGGMFRTTDTDLDLIYRNFPFPITMPNTEGEFVEAPIVILLSATGEYYEPDPTDPMNPATIPWGEPPKIMEGWVLAAVLCGIIIETPMGPMELPIGPVSYLTSFIEN
jgi:hypothetical protein